MVTASYIFFFFWMERYTTNKFVSVLEKQFSRRLYKCNRSSALKMERNLGISEAMYVIYFINFVET